MGVVMKQFIDRFKAMEKIANETLAANPEALVGVDSLPGSEHDAKVPDSAKKPDEEVAQGQPAGATTAAGAVSGGDAKVLNETKLEMDEPLLNPEKKPLITDDALTAKVANAKLSGLVGELLADLKAGQQKSAAPVAKAAQGEPDAKTQKITLDDETISKIAAAQATFMMGRKAAEQALGACEKKASANGLVDPSALIKAACVKAAQEAGLNPAEAEAAAENVMAAAGVSPDAVAAAAPVADPAAAAPVAAAPEAAAVAEPEVSAEEAAAALPDDVTEEELATAIVDLVQSGDLDVDSAKALVQEIAGEDETAAPTEDQAAEIIANGIESGEITPEQAQEIAAAIEGGTAEGEATAAEAQGAADAEAAIQDAKDEAQGAADAEAAMKAAAAQIRGEAIQKVASEVVRKRVEAVPGGKMLAKVASILKSREAEKQASASAGQSGDSQYIAGFKKKAAELGVDPAALARYVCSNAK